MDEFLGEAAEMNVPLRQLKIALEGRPALIVLLQLFLGQYFFLLSHLLRELGLALARGISRLVGGVAEAWSGVAGALSEEVRGVGGLRVFHLVRRSRLIGGGVGALLS